MKRIVICIEGGLVDQVLSEEPVEVLIIDRDTDDGDEERIVRVLNGDAFLIPFGEAEVNPEAVNEAFKVGEVNEAISHPSGLSQPKVAGVVCPKCMSAKVTDKGSGFVEVGEWNGKSYEEEFQADIFGCEKCGTRFLIN